jgi:hypothetical protein
MEARFLKILFFEDHSMQFASFTFFTLRSVAFAVAVALSGCGGGSSTTTPQSGTAVGPSRAGFCQTAVASVGLNCPSGTAMSREQLTAIIGTYDRGSSQILIGSDGSTFYDVTTPFSSQ